MQHLNGFAIFFDLILYNIILKGCDFMSDTEQIIRSINVVSLIDVEQRCNDAKDQDEWTLWNSIYNYILAQKQQKLISQGGPY